MMVLLTISRCGNGYGIGVWQELDLLLALAPDCQSHRGNSGLYRLGRQPGTTDLDHHQLSRNIAQEGKLL